MDEKDLEKKIEFIAITTLSALKGVFAEKKLDDRKVTLSLYYFLSRFIKHGWKKNKTTDVLKDATEVIEQMGDE